MRRHIHVHTRTTIAVIPVFEILPIPQSAISRFQSSPFSRIGLTVVVNNIDQYCGINTTITFQIRSSNYCSESLDYLKLCELILVGCMRDGRRSIPHSTSNISKYSHEYPFMNTTDGILGEAIYLIHVDTPARSGPLSFP